jgi:sugar lactone lactonase YvrE
MFASKVIRWTPAGGLSTYAEVAGRPSGLGFGRTGDLLVASMTDGKLLHASDGDLKMYADLSAYSTPRPPRWAIINDMVVDGRGNAYVDIAGLGSAGDDAGIALVRPDRSTEVVADGLLIPNGMVVTPDNRTLIVAELGSDRLVAFDIGDDGSLSGRRIWARVPESTPDGICLDSEGAVWVGSVYREEFLRVAEGGEVLARVPVHRFAMAPALGGEDGTTLFMMTADTTQRDLAELRARGFIEAVTVEVPGAGWP